MGTPVTPLNNALNRVFDQNTYFLGKSEGKFQMGLINAISEELRAKLTTNPDLALVRRSANNARRQYQCQVWSHSKQKVMIARLKADGKPLYESRGKEIALKATIKHNQEQIELTDSGAAAAAMPEWKKHLHLTIEEVFELYLDIKRNHERVEKRWSRYESMAAKARGKFKHVRTALPEVKLLKDLVQRPKSQRDFERWLDSQAQIEGGPFKASTLNAHGAWFRSFLSALKDEELLPDTFKLKSARKRPEGREDTDEDKWIPNEQQLKGLALFISKTPIKKAMDKNAVSDPLMLKRDALVTLVLAYTGLRRDTDAQPLIWDDFKIEKDGKAYLSLHMDSVKKTNRGKVKRWGRLQLLPQAIAALVELKKLHKPINGTLPIFPFVLSDYGRRLKVWSSLYYESIGLPGYYCTPHTLRSHAIERGIELGWSNGQLDYYFGNTHKVRQDYYSRLGQGEDGSLNVPQYEEETNYLDDDDSEGGALLAFVAS